MKVPLLEGLGVLCGTPDTLTSSTCLGFPSHTPHVPCSLDVQCPGRGSSLGRCQEVSERPKLSRHRCDIWEHKATSEALHSLWWGARPRGLFQHMLPGALSSAEMHEEDNLMPFMAAIPSKMDFFWGVGVWGGSTDEMCEGNDWTWYLEQWWAAVGRLLAMGCHAEKWEY